MRDLARIEVVPVALRTAWVKSPDLRLVKLIVNTVRPSSPNPEVFHAEDDAILRGLTNYREVLQRARAGKESGRS